MMNLIQTTVVSLVALIGLIVLIALKDVSSSVGVPVIVAIAGVHLGANISSNGSTPTPPTPPAA